MRVSLWITSTSLVLCMRVSVLGFTIQHSQSRTRSIVAREPTNNVLPCRGLFSSETDDADREDEQDTTKANKWNPIQNEKSQMPDYIASFLDKNDKEEKDPADRYTHMIAVPMDDCHELLLELESVQRAILYHCPLLVHSCIVPAVTRMPLLFVEATDKTVATVTRTLHDIVERVVKKQLFVKDPPVVVLDPDSEEEIMGGVNSEGYRPLVLSFQNLEIDGRGNEVLNTIGMDAPGSTRLTDLVQALKKEIEAMGWKVSFPPDDHATAVDRFRPRVPFMRLPHDFESLLDPLEEGQEDWMRTSDQGGNGISPIFWCQWWEDTMARNVRLREVSVYPRQPGVLGLGEKAFYIPHETTSLPQGNDALTKAEARHRSYNEKRMAEAEGRNVDDEQDMTEDTLRDPQVEEQRRRLETVYENSTNDAIDAAFIDDEIKDEIQQSLQAIDYVAVEEEKMDALADDRNGVDTNKKVPESQLDDWTKNRIRQTVEGLASVQARKVQEKEKTAIEDNPIFQKYRDGTLVEKKATTDPEPTKELPPYPSREHFFGIWRVVTSPTGFPEEIGDDTKSDNLILRVDGTIAGGPTLDRETNQKASGGTWKVVNATDDEGAKLRIRLVIPPKKERILVMEGEVTRFMSGSEIPLSKSSFGIPEVEAVAQKLDNDAEDLMHCGGDVWIEDAVTGKNREPIGTFSLMKIQSPLEPGKYTITIPRPVRNQD